MTEYKDCEAAAAHLRDRMDHIIQKWEDRASKVVSAKHQNDLVLRHPLPNFLEQLIGAFTSGDEQNLLEENEELRNELEFQSLEQIIDEYHLLRVVVLEVLEETWPIDPRANRLLQEGIDRAIKEATIQYVAKQTHALRSADSNKNEFLRAFAHELRSPLSAITSALFVLEKISLDERALRSATIINRQAQSMIRLVDDMTDISRISLGKVELLLETVSLSRLAEEVMEGITPSFVAKSQEFTALIAQEPLMVRGDPVRLGQVLSNVLGNATKYTPEGGRVEMTVRREGEEATVLVKDTGEGIEKEMLPRIFDLYTQVDSSEDHSQGGLGVGLSLVKRLVELHGGKVSAHSDGLGKGAEFIIRLPLVNK